MDSQDLLGLAADIVSAYLAHNRIGAEGLPGLIGAVHKALDTAGASQAKPVALSPAVPVRQSIKHDHIVCLEDGLRLKSLRRHLTASHGLTPESYRARWSLPPDYPMVAPDYAALRSEMAKQIGLGMRKPTPEPVHTPAKAAGTKASAAKVSPAGTAPTKTPQVKPAPSKTSPAKPTPTRPASTRVSARAATIEPPAGGRALHGGNGAPDPQARAKREPTAESVFANFQADRPRSEPPPDDAGAVLFAARRKPFAKQSARGMKQGKPANTRRGT